MTFLSKLLMSWSEQISTWFSFSRKRKMVQEKSVLENPWFDCIEMVLLTQKKRNSRLERDGMSMNTLGIIEKTQCLLWAMHTNCGSVSLRMRLHFTCTRARKKVERGNCGERRARESHCIFPVSFEWFSSIFYGHNWKDWKLGLCLLPLPHTMVARWGKENVGEMEKREDSLNNYFFLCDRDLSLLKRFLHFFHHHHHDADTCPRA